MIDFQPDIVHFSGHGGKGELWLEDDSGIHRPASAKGLAMMFKRFEKTTSCVVLNACSSKVQAEAISPYSHHVISTKKDIPDEAAIAFSTGFYKGLGSGDDVPEAFDLGRAAMELVQSGSGRIVLLAEGNGKAILNVGGKSPQKDKPLCFVIMSFSGNPRLQDFYQKAVKPTVEKFGLICKRVDEQEFNGSIKERVLGNLRHSLFVIADVSEHRPNVYYELGLAHALEKPVIHLALDHGDICFDVQDFNFIIYSQIDELRKRLKARIEATLEEIKAARLKLLWAMPAKGMDTSDEREVLSRQPKIDVIGQWYLKENGAQPQGLEEFDAVLYSYPRSRAGAQAQELKRLVAFITGKKPGAPLVVYTTGRVEGEDFKILSGYEKRKMPNMPSTLRQALEDVANAKRTRPAGHS